MSVRRIVTILTALTIGASIVATYTVDPLRWRKAVLTSKFSGEIPEIPLLNLFLWLNPASPVNLWGLASDPNPNAVVTNADHSERSAQIGGQIFAKHCAYCHGSSAEGGTGPSLVSALRSGFSDWAFFSAAKWGRAGTAMVAQPITDREIWQVHSFVRKITHGALGADEATGQDKIEPISVPFEAIRDHRNRPGDWLTYAGDYSGHRHTALGSITKENVRNLRIEWVAQLRSAGTALEASPIVYRGRLYITESPDGLVSLDAGTGKLLWRFRRPVPSGMPLCCGSLNRGAAILNDAIFLQTLDSYLVSVDAVTGQKRWEVKVAEYRAGYSMTGAPLALRDKLVVGVAGGDYGIRGFISAFRASDGQRLWTFNTVPGPGEVGHQTWGGDSWKTGGAATWATGAYDSDSGTVLWGVGNPGPDYQRDERPGDNLYSNSIVALDEKTGTIRWHYQFTPSDEHNWDSAQQPVLAEIPWEGQQHPVVLWANRNGFFYVLDRKTGKFLLANSFVKQTWTSGFDPNGRPIPREEARPSRTGTLVWPWDGGGTNWCPPSFDSKRLLLFVPTVDAASAYFRGEEARFERGKLFVGGTQHDAENQPVTAAIKAIDVTTGKIRWETRLAHGPVSTFKRVGGILSTASGVIFAGYKDDFLALDADTGQVLRRIHVGGEIGSAPVSYEVAGREFIAVVAGNSLFSFTVP